MKTLAIIICALNEQENISNVLDDILKQKTSDTVVLNKIIVVSDGSTDKTNTILQEYSKKYQFIHLLLKPQRSWKADSFNQWKLLSGEDYLISIDADVRIVWDRLFLDMEESLRDWVWLIWGNPIPAKSNTSIASLASLWSYYIVNEIKKRILDWNNFYSAHGRLLVLERDLYQKINLANMPWTDQFMFFSCMKNNQEFLYNSKLQVRYLVPADAKDYFKQNIRFANAWNLMKTQFWEEFVASHTKISVSVTLLSILSTSIKHPLCFVCWAIMFLIWKRKTFQQRASSHQITSVWEVSTSTKSKI